MRVLLVDDEQASRDELGYLLRKMEGIDIVGETSSGEDALILVRKLLPDVVFIDVEMPDISGVEVVRKIREEQIKIAFVFASAYQVYAVNAFDVDAVDYILKPFNETRLNETIEKIIKRINTSNNIEKNTPINRSFLNRLDQIYTILQTSGGISKLKVEDNEKIYLVGLDKIIYITIDERKVRIITEKKTYIASYTLNELELTLSKSFICIHKSFLANINKIESIISWFNNTYNLVMIDDSKIPVSRRYVKDFRRIIGI